MVFVRGPASARSGRPRTGGDALSADRSFDAPARPENEPRYRRLFEHHPHPMWVYDRETLRFLAVNEVAIQVYGYTREQFLERTIADIRPAEDVAKLLSAIARDPAGSERGAIWRHRLADGRQIEVEVTSHPTEFDGRPARMVMAIDVTSRRAAEEALRASERQQRDLAAELEIERARLAAAQAVAQVGSWETDLDTLEVVWSDETHRIFGTDPASFAPTHAAFLDRVHPEDREAVDAAFADSFSSREARAIEHRALLPDGSIRHVEERWQTFADASGRPIRALGTTRDLTERKLGEERFRLLAHATSDAIWDWDLLRNSMWWSDGIEALFGYSREEAESSSHFWADRVHPDDSERVSRDLRRAISGGAEKWSDEYRFRRRDGSYAWVLDRGHTIRDEAGKAVRMIGGMTDLTERRLAEERLADQAALLDATHEAILVRGLDDRVVFWNKGAERTYGWSAAEAVGRNLAELFAIEPSTLAAQRDVLLTGEHWQELVRHRTKDARELDIESSATLLRDARGAPKAILSFHVDVTERRRLETQLLRAQRLESLGRLAGGIAHDLNNVLAPILLALELLAESEERADRLELLATLEASAQRGADLVRQVLSFARGADLRKAALDLRAVVEEVAGIVRETLPKNVELAVRCAEPPWTVSADATQMHQVVMNLCVNARDAMPSGGRLVVRLENRTLGAYEAERNRDARPGPYVVLEVVDDGIGIAADDIDRLFEPFFTTKELGRGTGLGLSTVHAIVRGHAGFVTVESRPGRGTAFRVHLPAQPEATAVVAVTAAPKRVAAAARECILLVDDEAPLREVARAILERHGYRVVVAANGEEALRIFTARRDEIDAVLTDMSMPVMDGATMIVAIRTIDPTARVVGMSGLAEDHEVSRTVGFDVRHFVPKPYTAERLLSTLREALDENR